MNQKARSVCFGLFDSFFHYLRRVSDLVHGVDRHKRFRVNLADEVHQLAILVLINNRDNLTAGRVIVRARDLVESCSAVKLVEDEINDFIELRGDDAHSSLDVDTEYEVIDDHSAEIRTEDTEHHGLRIITECRCKRDCNSSDSSRASKIHSEKFVHNLRNDVESAGGCVV